jgi:hypothetical protein
MLFGGCRQVVFDSHLRWSFHIAGPLFKTGVVGIFWLGLRACAIPGSSAGERWLWDRLAFLLCRRRERAATVSSGAS